LQSGYAIHAIKNYEWYYIIYAIGFSSFNRAAFSICPYLISKHTANHAITKYMISRIVSSVVATMNRKAWGNKKEVPDKGA
jgi:hypothetical protein